MERRIIIIAPVKVLREGVASCIDRDGSGLKVTGTYPNAAEAVRAAHKAIDVALVDGTLGIETARHIRSREPAPFVVALGVNDDHDALRWMEAGATGIVPKDADLRRLVDVVEQAARGELVCSPRLTATLARRVEVLSTRETPHGPLDALTYREREIARLLQDGLSNKEIARALHIRPATVKNHVHRILEKLKLRRRGEVGALLRRRSTPPPASR